MQIRRSQDRGQANHGWLRSYHTFSFADYHDEHHMGFSVLRVINEDTVVPGAGFPTHAHRDMEIISYVLEGELEHKDNMGNGSVIRPGEVQRMSAGTGVTHSEYNPSSSATLRFLQIWIVPDHKDAKPGYEQKRFSDSELKGQLRVVASPDGQQESIIINQDARLFVTRLENAESVKHIVATGRKVYVHVAKGCAIVNGESLDVGDSAAIENQKEIVLTAEQHAEVLLFDLP